MAAVILFAGLSNFAAAGPFDVLAEDGAHETLVVGAPLFDHGTVGSLDKAELVDQAEGGQAADEADVGAFRRFDGTDAAVVGVVHVSHVKAGAVAAEAAGTEGAEASFVGEFRQRVGLVHELAELTAAEELLHGGHDGTDVDEGAGGGLIGVRDSHALAYDALHAQEADANLVLD